MRKTNAGGIEASCANTGSRILDSLYPFSDDRNRRLLSRASSHPTSLTLMIYLDLLRNTFPKDHGGYRTLTRLEHNGRDREED